jgi:uncharacterized protein YdeI (YjbR/CyaY-like superfamily)
VEAGQEVDVILELDLGPRTVEVPDALVAALADDPRAETVFDRMSFTHRKEDARGSPRRNATKRGSAASNRRSR